LSVPGTVVTAFAKKRPRLEEVFLDLVADARSAR
jgi:hypothetical protein